MKTPLHTQILHALNDTGHEAYLVGGYVRDTLLGRESKDIDIATSALPHQIQELFDETEAIGAHFGVILVKDGDETVEVATFRVDGDYTDGRRPNSVEFTRSLEEDLKRRDFTINALAMDARGDIHDFSYGLVDLEAYIIRAVGDGAVRFEEDALRMLRAIRFACTLGFGIETRTWLTLITNAFRIQYISAERIQQELNRILTSGNAAVGIDLLRKSGLLQCILPEIAALEGCEQNAVYHPEGDVYTHTLGLLQRLPQGCSLTLALAALFHDVGKPATQAWKDGQPTFHGHEDVGADMVVSILARLKYPNEVIEVVTNHVAQHMRFRVTGEMRRSKLYRFLRQPNFDELLALHKLDAASGSGNMNNAEFVESILNTVPPEKIRPPKLITGRDLIELGLKPGPEFGVILEAIETEQLEGRIASKEDAITFARDMVEFIRVATP